MGVAGKCATPWAGGGHNKGVFPMDIQIKEFIQNLSAAKHIVLTTHKSGDGDGVGAMVAFYHALIQQGKKVRMITVDSLSKKYHFLSTDRYVENFSRLKTPLCATDLALVFDTNDPQMVGPLYQELHKHCRQIGFVDHHLPPQGEKDIMPFSVTDVKAASTGEIVYHILKQMKVKWNHSIASALYTSVLFDTHRFQFLRGKASSYQICAEIYPYMKQPEDVYNQLFCFTSRAKLDLFAKAIQRVEFFYKGRVVFLEMHKEEFLNAGLEATEACDFIDRIHEIKEVEVAVLILKTALSHYKLSFRSKGKDICQLASFFGGGGHKNAAGATLKNDTRDIKQSVLKQLAVLFDGEKSL